MLNISLNLDCEIMSEESLIYRYDALSKNEKDILFQSYLHKDVVIQKILYTIKLSFFTKFLDKS